MSRYLNCIVQVMLIRDIMNYEIRVTRSVHPANPLQKYRCMSAIFTLPYRSVWLYKFQISIWEHLRAAVGRRGVSPEFPRLQPGFRRVPHAGWEQQVELVAPRGRSVHFALPRLTGYRTFNIINSTIIFIML